MMEESIIKGLTACHANLRIWDHARDIYSNHGDFLEEDGDYSAFNIIVGDGGMEVL